MAPPKSVKPDADDTVLQAATRAYLPPPVRGSEGGLPAPG